MIPVEDQAVQQPPQPQSVPPSPPPAPPQAQQPERSQRRLEVSSNLFDDVLDETTRRQAAELQISINKFDFEQRKARLFAQSGLFQGDEKVPEHQGIARAMIKIELGRSLGLSEAESLQAIDIIKGRTSIAANIRAARMKMAGYSWKIAWHRDPKTGAYIGITLFFYINGQPLMDLEQRNGEWVEVPATSTFTEADARHIDNFNKEYSAWKKSPRNMYFARAISNGQRWYAPHVISVNILSKEEAVDLEDIVDATELRQAAEEIMMPRRVAVAAPAAEAPAMQSAGDIVGSVTPKIDLQAAEEGQQLITPEQYSQIMAAANNDQALVQEQIEKVGYDAIGKVKQRDYASLLAKVADAAKLKQKSGAAPKTKP